MGISSRLLKATDRLIYNTYSPCQIPIKRKDDEKSEEKKAAATTTENGSSTNTTTAAPTNDISHLVRRKVSFSL